MKKISEMELDELRDYAIALENDKTELTTKLSESATEKAELLTLNTQLQKRNHELFLKVEQQVLGLPAEEPGEPEPVQSCEELGANLVKEIK